jgi:hypothetical protein
MLSWLFEGVCGFIVGRGDLDDMEEGKKGIKVNV